jgi:nucleoside phosphorylase
MGTEAFDSPALRAIAHDAWRDTARTVVSALSHRPGELGEAGKALAHVLDDPALPLGVDALGQVLASHVPEHLRAPLLETLDWELHTFRGGRKVEVSHRLVPLTPPLQEPAFGVVDTVGAPGFEDDVLSMDLAAPHSMGDLSRYANAYLGRTFVNDVIHNARDVELHNGTASEAMLALRSRGAVRFHQLATPKLHFQIILGSSSAGELRYAIACDDGLDMFRHIMKVLRAARSEHGGHVDPAHVSRFDHRKDEASYRPMRLRRCFESSGPIPPQVTVGFKNALLGGLRTRAARMSQLRALQRSTSLPAHLRAACELEPHELLRSGARCTWLSDLLTQAEADGVSGLPPLPASVTLDAADGPDDFLDHSRLAYKDATGAKREVLLVRNPYGAAAVAMGDLFRTQGVRDILVYGTAASLDLASQVGELHLASQATSPDGAVFPFENHALHERFSALHAHPETRLGSKVVNVRSPTDELDREIERLRADGHHLIEMELAGLLRGLSGGGARVAALHVVSDVPQSKDTLESFSPTRAERALSAAVDVWVDTFGMAELELR